MMGCLRAIDDPTANPRWLSPSEARAALMEHGVEEPPSARTLTRMIERGDLAGQKLGGRYFIDAEAIPALSTHILGECCNVAARASTTVADLIDTDEAFEILKEAGVPRTAQAIRDAFNRGRITGKRFHRAYAIERASVLAWARDLRAARGDADAMAATTAADMAALMQKQADLAAAAPAGTLEWLQDLAKSFPIAETRMTDDESDPADIRTEDEPCAV